MKLRALSGWIWLLFVPLVAQDAPKPGPEHERMKAFVGTWTMTVNNKGSLDPSAPPAGRCAGTETFEMLGEFFVVRNFVVRNYEITCDGMRGKGLEIFRWDAAKRMYVVTAFGDGGGHVEFNVTAARPTWSLLDRGVAKGKKYWHRCSFTFVSSDRVEHTCDDSADGRSGSKPRMA